MQCVELELHMDLFTLSKSLVFSFALSSSFSANEDTTKLVSEYICGRYGVKFH